MDHAAQLAEKARHIKILNGMVGAPCSTGGRHQRPAMQMSSSSNTISFLRGKNNRLEVTIAELRGTHDQNRAAGAGVGARGA